MNTLDFFSSASAVSAKLHLELLCNGVSRQRLYLRLLDDGSGGDESTDTPNHVDDHSESSGSTNEVWTAPKLALYEGLSLKKLSNHVRRPCRVCAMEKVLDLAHRTRGPRRIPVTFSGQYVPDEVGVHSYSWEDVSDTARARLERIAERMNLPTTHTASGPVAYGLVNSLTFDLLSRNLRTYRLGTALTARLVNADPRIITTVDTYWMLRNTRPPELHDNSDQIEQMALALAH